ncbi:VUT family protein [Streptomyces xiamenensis]|uniref:VUT family protein n=1 Tax=Streptomyces xiamenensis TaxID=408015 RepID=UPI0035DD7DB0
MPLDTQGLIATTAYLATVPAANLLTTHAGAVPVGLGQAAPAGAFAAGAALVLRDLIQERAGKTTALAAVGAGSVLACLVAPPSLALASATSFAVAELADAAVYTPLRERGRLRAVAASSAVGLVIDSALFTWLAFGTLHLAPGLVLAKVYLTAAALAAMAATRTLRKEHRP